MRKFFTPIVNAKSVEDINVLTKEEGKERIFRDIEKQKKNSTTYAAKAVSYNKSKAVEYAKIMLLIHLNFQRQQPWKRLCKFSFLLYTCWWNTY